MIFYLYLAVFLTITVFLGYYALYLMQNSKGSRLYLNISIAGILGLFISLINVFSLINDKFNLVATVENLSFSFHFLNIIFTYYLFKIWEIRYNQLEKQNYNTLIVLLTLINVFFLFNSKYDFLLVVNSDITQLAPAILNIIILMFVNVLFAKYNKLAKSRDFRLLPLAIFIILLINIGLVFIDFSKIAAIFYYFIMIILSLSYLIILKLCVNDYKKSFYY